MNTHHCNPCKPCKPCGQPPAGCRPPCPHCLLHIVRPGPMQQLGGLPAVEGFTYPLEAVRIYIDDHPPLDVTADGQGVFSVPNPYPLADGPHTVCATSRPHGCRTCVPFSLAELPPKPDILPIAARMGRTFRTVDVDVQVRGFSGPATVYYLLLPPGSEAPSAADITGYANTAALLDGTAATGQFAVSLSPGETTYTWALTGLDKPGAPQGVTGVVDGYRYDVYLWVALPGAESGVLTFGAAAMGMPFATGLGTEETPFTIRQLTPAELALYPDLLAGNPLNQPGVDETARMLENIERLITLYEDTDGYYGLETSMSLHYLMTSDIDLAGYAAAYGGEGWQSIGDIDGWINDLKQTEHLFSGVFAGDGHTIANLSITPTATADNFVGYRGLFGGVDQGTIQDLTLTGVVISAYTTVPGNAQLGSLISIARNPTLLNLSLQGANLTADSADVSIGDNHTINMGGFVGEIYDGCTVRGITGRGISIVVPSTHALALGGFVGFTDKFEAPDSFEDITLTGLTLSGYAMVGGLAGYMVYGVNLMRNITASQVNIIAPGGQAGGLVGRLYLYSAMGDSLIESCAAQGVYISTGGPADPGSAMGGLIGLVQENPFAAVASPGASRVFGAQAAPMAAGPWPMTVIRSCAVTGGQVACGEGGGGLIGRMSIAPAEADGRQQILLCRADIPVSGTGGGVGGLVGQCRQIQLSRCYALGAVTAGGQAYGGLVGSAADSLVADCYATGSCQGQSNGGGLVGALEAGAALHSYAAASVSAGLVAGGLVGMGDAAIQSCLVLGGGATAATAHRILGAGTAPVGNYALDTVFPVPGAPDPNGLDGGTITAAQIVPTMATLGWDTATVWDTASVATLGRPTLLQNPEEA